MGTYSAKPAEINQRWYVIDAAGQHMGRLAVDVARILRGKHKVIFTPHMDTGDFVIVINAEQIVYTGNNKAEEKIYRHSGWPGALKHITRGLEMEKKPEEALRRVVKGMIPHNKLGRALIGKLKVYRGAEHPHAAQKPIPYTGMANLNKE